MATFFVSYTGVDRDWAEWIAWELEAAGHKAIIQAWDFRPGMNFVLEMDEATKADHTIAVLTASYMTAVYTRPEWSSAFAQDAIGRACKLIPVRVQPVELTGLLSQIIYIDLVGKNEEAARLALLEGIAEGRAKPMHVPFPGARSASEPLFPGSGDRQPQSVPSLPENVAEVLRSAQAEIGSLRSNVGPYLHIAVHPSPVVSLMRPSEFDSQALADELLQEALFRSRILSNETSSPVTRGKGTISVSQRDASFKVDECGRVTVSQRATDQGGLVIVEEDLVLSVEKALRFAHAAVSAIAVRRRVQWVGIAAYIEGADCVGWMTRAERAASPNSVSIPGFGRKPNPVELGRLVAFEELAVSTATLTSDLVALLRRETKG